MNRDYLKHLGFTQTAITMSISTKCTCGRSLNGLCNTRVKECTQFAPMITTQLPAEVNHIGMWVNLRERMPPNDMADDYPKQYVFKCKNDGSRGAVIYEQGDYDACEYLLKTSAYDVVYWLDEAGATAYALKLHEAQQEIERLKGWKSEASTLLDPILNYGQSKEANVPLGESITDVVLERCKRYDRAQQLIKDWEDVDKDHKRLVREIDNIITGGMPAKQAALCDLVRPIEKLQSKHNDAVELLEEAVLQLEYLSKKFGETGSGNNVLSRIKTFLDGTK